MGENKIEENPSVNPLLFINPVAFQFNDRLLVCSVGSWNHSYKVKAWFEVEQLNVLEGDNLITEFTFYISDGSKEIELYTR